MHPLQLMENAGRALAITGRAFLRDVRGTNILVLAGKGSNGGGALVAARRLAGWGAFVTVALTEESLDDATARQRKTLEAMGVTVHVGVPEIEEVDLVLDGLLGAAAAGAPIDAVADLIRWA